MVSFNHLINKSFWRGSCIPILAGLWREQVGEEARRLPAEELETRLEVHCCDYHLQELGHTT